MPKPVVAEGPRYLPTIHLPFGMDENQKQTLLLDQQAYSALLTLR